MTNSMIPEQQHTNHHSNYQLCNSDHTFSKLSTFCHVEFSTVIRLRPERLGFHFLQLKRVFLDPCAALRYTRIMANE